MAALLAVDRRAELFGVAVTIADLALFSLPDHDGDEVTIYQVWDVLERDWSFKLDRDDGEAEYAIGATARFNDGSVLHIAARADCCDGSGCRHCRGY
ncbi:hypothetical protein [Novosphingobium sp. Fuku2-ISO-50]|uniref:hypothetical protein n=1 Tax=Novosphingobium sp. Fuku2-ISO-50 TaxID=1739114 RepID=UPI00076DF1E1|nr:hypothetical protein [Novosphingobium sp. Fuku2-ISO-50]KUR75289.1 hypothetical protein AQZ50_15615 [Novosphingobium sp. Fuku2-ISO-50]